MKEREHRLSAPTVSTSEPLILHLPTGDPDSGCASAVASGIGWAHPRPYVEARL